MPEKIVTVIESKAQAEMKDNFKPPKRRVAAYARVSTDEEEQVTSYENQVEYYPRYIQSKPDWEYVGIYTDKGISGLNTKHRDGFNQMMEDAKAGKIDLIITKSISRFARNTVDSLTAIRELKNIGVEVYFEKENIYTFDSKGELVITIMSSIAQEESRSISENVTWGRRKNMARGVVSMSFGRFLGYEKGLDGKPQIVEEEAAIVRRIFDMYLKGNSVREIARVLTENQIPTPSKKNCNWSVSTIMSILRNEKYKGDALLQKTYIVDYITKKSKKNNGDLPQYYVENSHPAIIDRETFDLVQKELASRAGRNRGRSSNHIFERKIVCGHCGHAYGKVLWYSHGAERNYVWRCRHKYDGAEVCPTPTIHDGEIERAFKLALDQLLADKESYFEELEQEIEHLLRQTPGTANSEERIAVNARLAIIRRHLHNLCKQPGIVTKFDPEAFSYLVEQIKVQKNGDMIVCFKDGKEVTVAKN